MPLYERKMRDKGKEADAKEEEGVEEGDGDDAEGGEADDGRRQLLKLKADNKRLCALWEAQLQGEVEDSENVGPVSIVFFTSLHIQMLCSLWRIQFQLVNLFYTAGCIHDQDQSLPQRH